MDKPEIPQNESQRIDALCSLNLLDTPTEERFDRLTRITQRHFGVPIALVSLVDRERQWFKSSQGFDAQETPRDISFCGHAILEDDIFYIPNALNDPRFANNPLVTAAPNIRFYAGAPLHAPNGERIGTLCIIDDKPRDFSDYELSLLRDLADSVEAELEHTRLEQFQDKLQSGENRIRAIIETVVDGIVTIDLHGFVRSFNPSAEKIFGYSAEEVIGNNVKMLMPESYAVEHDGYLHNYLTTGKKKVIGSGREVIGQRKDGSIFPMELAVSEMDVSGERMFTGIVRDISERKTTENALIKAKEIAEERTAELARATQQARDDQARVSAVLETVLDAIITIDKLGTVESYNPAAEQIFGYTAEEVIGQNVKCLMPSPYHEEHDGYLHRYHQTDVPHVIGIGREVIGQRKDGSTFPMDLAVSKMVVRGSTMFTGVVRDITERKKVEDALLFSKEEAERNNRIKSEFLNMMSHELRTPLTVIIGYLPLLIKEGQMPEPAMIVTIAQEMESSGNHLLHLINDLLDISKIEAGQMLLKIEHFPISELVQTVLDNLKVKVDDKQIQLINDTQNEILCADKFRLKQILINLVGNAIKFTKQGSISVLTRTLNNVVEFSVSDTGMGMPAEDLPHIFDKFRQVDSSSTRASGGTGLGLAITKKLVELHNGQITVASEPGKGTTFTFTIENQEIDSNG